MQKIEHAYSTYQKSKIEANNDGAGNGDGSELHVTEVAGYGQGDDVHGVGCHAAEDGGPHYVPQLLCFCPHPQFQLFLLFFYFVIFIIFCWFRVFQKQRMTELVHVDRSPHLMANSTALNSNCSSPAPMKQIWSEQCQRWAGTNISLYTHTQTSPNALQPPSLHNNVIFLFIFY